MRKLSFILCVCFAATLAAARPAAAQELCTPPDYTIQVIKLPSGVITPVPDQEVERDDCVCWGSNARKEFKIWFPIEGPFSTDTLVVQGQPSRVCDRAVGVGHWYYTGTLDEDAIPDPWLNVTP